MTAAAAAWLAALTGTQREKACFAFGEERRGWSFLPARDRDGLPIARSTMTSADSRTS